MSSEIIKRKADDSLTVSPDVLKCSLCRDSFDARTRTPRNLECGHHFCELCLTVLTRQTHSITCPTCQTETAVNDSNVLSLAKNWAIVAMVDEASRLAATFALSPGSIGVMSATIATHCELCTEMHAATHHCRECEQSMCQVIVGMHRKMRGTMQHCLVPIADVFRAADNVDIDGGSAGAASVPAPPAVSVCARNQHVSAIEYFDFHCLQGLCRNCVLSHTQLHSNRIKVLAEAAPLCRVELQNLSMRFDQWQSQIEKTIDGCTQCGVEVVAEKDCQVDQVVQMCKQVLKCSNHSSNNTS